MEWPEQARRGRFVRAISVPSCCVTQMYYCGLAGMGLHAKLSQNIILGNLLQAFNESLVLSTKAGVDPEVMLDILNNSAARSGLISLKAPMVFKRDFSTNFSVKWLEKDIGLILDSAAELNVPAASRNLLKNAAYCDCGGAVFI